jgi:dienelactone hydrolase
MNVKIFRPRSALFLVSLAVLAIGATQATAAAYVDNVPFSTPYYTFTVQSDVVYGQGEIHWLQGGGSYKDLTMDLYIPDIPPPEQGINRMPVMLMLHGGGFAYGDKTDAGTVASAEEYAMRGWLVAAINYRQKPDDPVPSSRVTALWQHLITVEGGATPRNRTRAAAVDDTLTALDFLHDRSDVKNTWTFLWGNSAGGNTVLATAYALDDNGISRPLVASVIENSGRFENAAVGNPFDNTPGSDPVLLSIAGTEDSLYPYSLETHDWAIAAGLQYDWESIDGAGHLPDPFSYIASTQVLLFQQTVDWQHQTVFAGLDQGPQPPPGC